jgi:hypothetical protein
LLYLRGAALSALRLMVRCLVITGHWAMFPAGSPHVESGLCSRMDAVNGPSQLILNAQKELARRRQLAGVSYCPPTVSSAEWGMRKGESTAVPSPQAPVVSGHYSATSPQQPDSARAVRIAPTLAAFCLDPHNRFQGARLDGPYRLYKILQTLDAQGRGWLANRWVEQLLTKKKGPFYVYGRRQLKIMLRRGEGLFWQRVCSGSELRIRLMARGKVVGALGCGPLRGREVTLPLAYLLGSGRGRQADVNAALYAAVHAGRLRPDQRSAGPAKARPISRARLQDLAGCSRYRQRSYERRMKIAVLPNIHIAGAHSNYELERTRQYLGLPAYKHTDFQGKVNRHQHGARYIAMRLPNSYQVPDTITVVSSRRQHTINRSLDGLCLMGSGGSGREEIVRLYHRDAATAVRAFSRDPDTPAYWPLTGNGRARLWQTVGQSGRVVGGRSIPHSAFHSPYLQGGDLD